MAKLAHLTDKDFNAALPAETKEKYAIKGMTKRSTLCIYSQKYGHIDFSKLSVARAAQLVKMGAPFIEEVKPKSNSKTPEAGSK
jgi:hypothetical protein